MTCQGSAYTAAPCLRAAPCQVSILYSKIKDVCHCVHCNSPLYQCKATNLWITGFKKCQDKAVPSVYLCLGQKHVSTSTKSFQIWNKIVNHVPSTLIVLPNLRAMMIKACTTNGLHVSALIKGLLQDQLSAVFRYKVYGYTLVKAQLPKGNVTQPKD